MKVINRCFFLASCAMIGLSCSGTLDRKAFVRWVTDYDHGLHVKREADNVVFDLQYTPADYVWLQRTGGRQPIGEGKELKEISALQYYTLTINAKDNQVDFMNLDVRDDAEKQRRLYYFSYLFQNDITVEDNGKVLPCILFHFERPADLRSGGRTFVLGFENPFSNSEEAKLVITSEHLGSLPIKIKVSKKNIPSLSI